GPPASVALTPATNAAGPVGAEPEDACTATSGAPATGPVVVDPAVAPVVVALAPAEPVAVELAGNGPLTSGTAPGHALCSVLGSVIQDGMSATAGESGVPAMSGVLPSWPSGVAVTPGIS